MKEIENGEIFDLLAIKTYEALNSKERELVDKELSRSEYEDLSELIGGFKELDDTIEITRPEIKYKKNIGKRVWWSYKIPTYQVAAILVLTIGSTFMLTKNNMDHSKIKETNFSELDRMIPLNKSVNMKSEKYPTAFVIHW